MTHDALLAVDRLTVTFPVAGRPRPAVQDVAFDLRRGRVLALVGESGSGKTVTSLAALGLLPPTARVTGSIRLAGEELVGAAPDRLRQVRGGRIGTVFQEPATALNPVFTIGDQIAEAVWAHRDTTRAQRQARVSELLDSVGLADPDRVARGYPHQLSGGQLQRATIAMAISCDPELLIADEPTTALDVTIQAGILELLRDLRTRLDMGILLITHDMGVVADIADEVVVLRDGCVVEQADTARLFVRPEHPYTRDLLAAVPRLADLRPPAPDAPAAPYPGGNEAGAPVRLRDVVVEYRGRRRGAPLRAVDGVSLHVEAGEVLGLAGESGSGKSTLARVLAGLVPVASGSVRVAGADLTGGSRRDLRRARSRTGIVFQDPASSLNPRWTVGDSVAEPLGLHLDLHGTAARLRVAQLLAAVGLPADMADRYPHEMSGGQRQRVAIARALALGPDLLIADEPTSALDVSVQARILDLIRDLQRRHRFACLLISHDLAVVARLADRVAVMYQGRVVEQGPTAQVLAEPRDPYTRRLLAAAPVADPVQQARRRAVWRELTLADQPAVDRDPACITPIRPAQVP